MEICIVDTGAIVALFDEGDRYHSWAKECFQNLGFPLLTCESVVTEAWHLLASVPLSHNALASALENEVLRVDFQFAEELYDVTKLLRKYRDTPMDFADACLVRMSEVHRKYRVWTIDSDFRVYRRFHREMIPVLAPWS